MKGFLPIALASLLLSTTATAQTASASAQGAAAPATSGKKINRALEVLQSGQPVYYRQVSGGGYEDGQRLAATEADYITYDMEHGPFDIKELRDFMQGLVDAGPTRTGHRTPTVIVTLPILGDDPEAMRANAWVAQQVLAAGAHGILLCQAESPEAVRIFMEAIRFPFAPGARPSATHRGNGSEAYASTIWGVDGTEYLRVADPYPLNPEGELMIGLKIENPKAVANADELASIPGVTFVEWGPGDQSLYRLGLPPRGSSSNESRIRVEEPSMVAARAQVLAAAKKHDVFFLNACEEDTVLDQLREGVMICTGGDTPAADKGREFTNRTTPW